MFSGRSSLGAEVRSRRHRLAEVDAPKTDVARETRGHPGDASVASGRISRISEIFAALLSGGGGNTAGSMSCGRAVVLVLRLPNGGWRQLRADAAERSWQPARADFGSCKPETE